MLALLLTPASTVPAAGCTPTFSSSVVYHAPTGTPSGKRLYLWPGLNSPVTQWEEATTLAPFIAGLRAAGHSVVLASLPTAQACFFDNGGWQYRELFNTHLNAIMDATEGTYGSAEENVAGGISFGGLHAMLAASSNGRISAWWALKPVTRIDALTELPSVGDVKRFNPQFLAPELSMKPGWIGWDAGDTRVNGPLTAALATQLPAETETYTGTAHGTTTAMCNDILAWVNAL